MFPARLGNPHRSGDFRSCPNCRPNGIGGKPMASSPIHPLANRCTTVDFAFTLQAESCSHSLSVFVTPPIVSKQGGRPGVRRALLWSFIACVQIPKLLLRHWASVQKSLYRNLPVGCEIKAQWIGD